MEDLTKLLRESRNLLQLCTLLDKSGLCEIMVEKIDEALTIPIVSESLRMEELLMFYSKHPTFNFNSSIVEVLSALNAR